MNSYHRTWSVPENFDKSVIEHWFTAPVSSISLSMTSKCNKGSLGITFILNLGCKQTKIRIISFKQYLHIKACNYEVNKHGMKIMILAVNLLT